ncbi:glycosyltransferase family 2 protein [Pseudonocardia pini]|uniref:glycosyltransferase family 2 protein n=1 Tax=Pseudonocardia pini TaxID=2758030 RepID=UPI0015F04ACA|nr:glycosyltransferase family 2 protein [Pseudonocardia pini]
MTRSLEPTALNGHHPQFVRQTTIRAAAAATRQRTRTPRVSVVLPTLNEAKNLEWVLTRMPADLHEVVLVDGRSTDDTVAEAKRLRPDVRVVLQSAKGKGAAMALGFANVTGDIAVVIDADGSMDPAEIPGMVGALLSGADVVKGSRAAAGGGSLDLTALRRAGNWGLTFLANRIYHQHWRELCYGYAAFWTDVLPLLGIQEIVETAEQTHEMVYGHGFEIEAILFCRAARANLRVAEVFSFEHERRNGESNLATWSDGWRVLTAVRKERRYRFADAMVARNRRTYPVVPFVHGSQDAA